MSRVYDVGVSYSLPYRGRRGGMTDGNLSSLDSLFSYVFVLFLHINFFLFWNSLRHNMYGDQSIEGLKI